MQQRWPSRGILVITRSANLVFQLWSVWRESRGEAERRRKRRGEGELKAEDGRGGEGGLGDARVDSLSSPGLHSPCDHIGSEAEHEGADEGADLPRRPLSTPLLLLQAALANTGGERVQQLYNHTWGRPHSVSRTLITCTEELVKYGRKMWQHKMLNSRQRLRNCKELQRWVCMCETLNASWP